MIYKVPKKQQGGSLGNMTTKAFDRSPLLQYQPKPLTVPVVPSTMGGGVAETQYKNMLPSDQKYISQAKKEIVERMKVNNEDPDYAGSLRETQDIEEYNNVVLNRGSQGKHYIDQFKANINNLKKNGAGATLAVQGGNALVRTRDGNYTIVPVTDMFAREGKNMKYVPVTLSEASMQRQSNANFNSFNTLGEFVDNLMVSAYDPENLNKTLKTLTSGLGSDKKVIETISKRKSGVKTNRDQIQSVSNYFRKTSDDATNNYINSLAIKDLYNQALNGQFKPKNADEVGSAITGHSGNLLTDFFASRVSTDELTKASGGTGAEGGSMTTQKLYKFNPFGASLFQAGNNLMAVEIQKPGEEKTSKTSVNKALDSGLISSFFTMI